MKHTLLAEISTYSSCISAHTPTAITTATIPLQNSSAISTTVFFITIYEKLN